VERRWVQAILFVVWILNLALCVAATYFLLNWSAFVWIVGSQTWAFVCEVVCVICLDISLLFRLLCVRMGNKHEIKCYSGRRSDQ